MLTLPVELAGEVELEPGLEVGELGIRELVEPLLESGDGTGAVALRAPDPGPQPGRLGRQQGDAEPLGPSVQLRRGVGRLGGVAPTQFGLDQHAEEGRGSHAVVGHGPQPAAGRRRRQLVVLPGQVQPSRRRQRLEMVVAAEQQRLGLRQPALEDAQLGQGDRRVPAVAGHDPLDVVHGVGEDALGLAPPPEVAEHDSLHATAVAVGESRRPDPGSDDAPLAEERLHVSTRSRSAMM